MAPLLIIVIAVSGFILGPEAAQGLVVSELGNFMGPENAQVLQDAIVKLDRSISESAGMAGAVGLGTLFLGAMGVVRELQSSLNFIWRAQPKRRGILRMLRNRLIAFAFILSLGFLLLVSLILSAVMSGLGKYFTYWLPVPAAAIQILNLSSSFLVVTLLFAMIFKILPEVRIAWRDVWTGAAVTSALFIVGNFLLGLYLGRRSIASAYGAAGSLVLFLLWTYYCAQILYFGAEFTHVYASTHGSRADLQTNGTV